RLVTVWTRGSVRKDAAHRVCARCLRATLRPPAASRCAIFVRMEGFPALGQGLGLRPPFYEAAAAGTAPVDWWEVISENFMVEGGNPRRVLRAARAHRPIVLHGVSMSLGSTDPLDDRYLDRLAALAAEIEPAWISDHLC